ncbi:restriction endonuclease subunit S [Anaerococcus murdochii]|uniref:restriction endonuclease subunit S n=1 Tax=Anaerococcus murdochii TaxID=411577 RepID=UPI0032B3F95C
MTKKIPEIRFDGFSGEWEEKKLGDFGTVQMNKRIYKKETSESGEIPFYKIGSFGSTADTFISRELFEEYKEKYPYPEIGALLISASGSIGKVVEYKGEEAYFQDSNIVWLDHDERISNKFLKQFYQVVRWDGIEGTTIKRLYNKNILNTKISYPEIAEQEKIGELFETLDACLEDQAAYVETLKKFKKAFLQKLFPQKGEKVPDLRFPGFEGDWENLNLKGIISYEIKGKAKVNDIKTGNVEYLDADRLNGGKAVMSDFNKDVNENDILILWDGSNAGAIYSGYNGALGSTLKALKLKENYDSNFVYTYLKKNERKINEKYTTPNIPHVTKDFTEIFKIQFPSLSEQEKIGSFFKELDYKIEKEEDKLASLERLKTALLQKIFV